MFLLEYPPVRPTARSALGSVTSTAVRLDGSADAGFAWAHPAVSGAVHLGEHREFRTVEVSRPLRGSSARLARSLRAATSRLHALACLDADGRSDSGYLGSDSEGSKGAPDVR